MPEDFTIANHFKNKSLLLWVARSESPLVFEFNIHATDNSIAFDRKMNKFWFFKS